VGEAVRTGGLTDAALDDYAISRELGGAVAARADYGWQLEAEPPFVLFAYPPPDALLHAALAALGGLAGPLLFMAALAAAGWAGARSVLTLLGAEELPLRWLGVLLGVLACRAFVQSDLHLLNSNVLAVGLALAAWRFLDPTSRRPLGPACGGLLLAASLAVKPWAVGLPLVLVALRRWRELGWTLSGLGLAFVVVPALMLGPGDAAKLLASWIDVLRQAASVAAIDRIAVDNVSLAAALDALGLARGRVAAIVGAAQVLWLAALAALVASALRRPADGAPPGGRTWLLVGTTVLVAPVPLSPILQPHHLVAWAPLSIVVGLDVVDRATARADRIGRIAVLAGVFALSSYAPAGPARGFAHVIGPLLLVAAAWLRPPGPSSALSQTGPLPLE